MNSKKLLEYRDKSTGLIDFDRFQEENPDIEYFDEDRGIARRDKKWVFFDDKKVLVRNEYLDQNDVKYTTYQELVFEELAKQVNFPCAHYDIGKRRNKKCILLDNILDTKENQSLSMMSLRELMEQIDDVEYYFTSYNIIDAFKAIDNHCKCMKLGKEVQEDVMKQFCKMQVLDCFLSSSDRHVENISFIYGKDKKRKRCF